MTIISDLREAEERAEREWREARMLDRAEKLLLYLEARGVALKHAANSATA